MATTAALATNNYGPAKFIVATSAANGTHTTLTTAMAAASSGDTIFLRDSVTENVTITPGVNITAWSSGSLNTPSITGTLTMTGAGTSTLSGLELITNSAAIIAVTGSAASILNVRDCYLNCSNNTGITYSSSSSSSALNIFNCSGDLGTTGIALFSDSSAGNLRIQNAYITNTGGSTTASTVSGSGDFTLENSTIAFPITTSSTSTLNMLATAINTATQNVICLTVGSSGVSGVRMCAFASGSASAISIGTGATLGLIICEVNSTNTNAITGVGSVSYSGLSLPGSKLINTTTQTGGLSPGGVKQAPSAGFIGEQITATATAVSLSNSTPANITSISLTAGIWDVSGMGSIIPTAANSFMAVGVSATSATLSGSAGVNYANSSVTVLGGTQTFSVPNIRATLTATTTYYLVGQCNFSSGTCTANGRISATRVG